MMPFDSLPEPMQEAMKAQFDAQRDAHERYHMQINNEQHNTNTFFTGLGGSDTQTLLVWLTNLLENPGTAQMQIAMAIGDLSRQLQQKLDICPACGKNHDEEIAKALEQPLEADPDPENLTPEQRFAQELNVMPLAADPVTGDDGAPKKSRKELMEEYGMEMIDRQGIPTLVCKNCGHESPNLKDRMMKPPGIDGCQGCQLKAKWG